MGRQSKNDFLINVALWLAIAITMFILVRVFDITIPVKPFGDGLARFAACSPLWIVAVSQAIASALAAIICVEVVGRSWVSYVVRNWQYFTWLGALSIILFSLSFGGLLIMRGSKASICT